MNENESELQCLEWFRDIGWDKPWAERAGFNNSEVSA